MELFENEQIKPIEGFENSYAITNFGRVWSYLSKKWLKTTINQRGNHTREYVSLGRGNKRYIHQLVAKAFIPNPNNYKEVDHIDANGLNNHADNLRWVTHDQNMKNDNTIENVKKNHGWFVEIEEIETGKVFYGYEEAAAACHVSKATIGNHVKGRVKNPRWKLTGNRIEHKN